MMLEKGMLKVKKALIVGLNNYPNGNALNWCDNDAVAISSLIESNGDGSPNFDIKQIIDECTKEYLQFAIEKLFSDEADIALLYFSGHGSSEDGGYLVTTDFDRRSLGVRMMDVLRFANESKCKNKVIILDCCFSAKMGESILVNNNSVLGEGVTIMAASQSWQTSVENSSKRHGVFTDLLLQGLKGGAADISGNITPASLYAFVDQSLGAWEQRPVFKTNISQFLPIRTINAKVPKEKLRMISRYFPNPSDEYKLDPSYEFTNTPNYKNEPIEPYAEKEKIAIFKDLQLYESVGLVEPVDTEHMYFAAMQNKSCKLTALGLHYWRLSKDRRF